MSGPLGPFYLKDNQPTLLVAGEMTGAIPLSQYHIPTKTLIAGDALNSKNGKLLSFDNYYSLDHPTALKSIAKLLELDIKKVITYHGDGDREFTSLKPAQVAGFSVERRKHCLNT